LAWLGSGQHLTVHTKGVRITKQSKGHLLLTITSSLRS